LLAPARVPCPQQLQCDSLTRYWPQQFRERSAATNTNRATWQQSFKTSGYTNPSIKPVIISSCSQALLCFRTPVIIAHKMVHLSSSFEHNLTPVVMTSVCAPLRHPNGTKKNVARTVARSRKVLARSPRNRSAGIRGAASGAGRRRERQYQGEGPTADLWLWDRRVALGGLEYSTSAASVLASKLIGSR
jgi:hypothetical protein